ncbi:hypothetical protein AS132_00465 [Photobacterium sanguinicancri]|nr:hypothetical protein AS132_00465 [Photobacterium sanguinicancri]
MLLFIVHKSVQYKTKLMSEQISMSSIITVGSNVIMAIVMFSSQFYQYFTPHKVIGFPLNYVSYFGKTDTYQFFPARLITTGVFWLFIFILLNIFILLAKKTIKSK